MKLKKINFWPFWPFFFTNAKVYWGSNYFISNLHIYLNFSDTTKHKSEISEGFTKIWGFYKTITIFNQLTKKTDFSPWFARQTFPLKNFFSPKSIFFPIPWHLNLIEILVWWPWMDKKVKISSKFKKINFFNTFPTKRKSQRGSKLFFSQLCIYSWYNVIFLNPNVKFWKISSSFGGLRGLQLFSTSWPNASK